VKSLRGTQFRRWALNILREYLIKGFTMNDDLLKKAGGGNYLMHIADCQGVGSTPELALLRS